MSRTLYPQLLYPPPDSTGTDRHRAMNGVVRILKSLQDQKQPPAVGEREGVLLDQIMDLWPNQEEPMLPPVMSQVTNGSLLHRWIVQDGIYSAAGIAQRPEATAVIQAAQQWVRDPSHSNRQAAQYAAEALEVRLYSADYQAIRAAISSAYAVYNGFLYAAEAAYYAFDVSAYTEARNRLRLLQMLSDADILPEPTATAIQNRGGRGLYRL